MSSFFTVPGVQKRKRNAAPENPKKRLATSGFRPSKAQASKSRDKASSAAPAKKRVERDESISGSDSDSDNDQGQDAGDFEAGSGSDDDSEREGETAAERRLRLAERYLDNVRQEVAAEDEYAFDAEEIDRDIIAERLREDVAESKGKVYRHVARELDYPKTYQTGFRWNPENVTGVATCPPYAYLVTKDMFLSKWKLQDLPQYQWPQMTKKKSKKPNAPPKRRPEKVASLRGDSRKASDKSYHGHTGAILAVAASQDGKWVVTAGADKRIVVHDAETLKPVRALTHHRDAVTSLAFQRGTNQLYSGSRDRTVKVWNIDNLAYIETLFGHQDHVVDIDALAQERCVSAGARDRTARLWKVVEESQLVFRGGGGTTLNKKNNCPEGVDPKSLAHEGNVDRIAMLDDELFVTGSDNGSISLWSLQKKRPVFVLPLAHGLEPPLPLEAASADKSPDPKVIPPPQPRWITALRTIPYSDLVLSGSWDGCVRIWRLSDDKKKLEAAGVLGQPLELSQDMSAFGKDNSKAKVITNGDNTATNDNSSHSKFIKGIVNDISVFERGDRGKDGICIVAAVGKEHRLGRWKRIKGGQNGAFVFEVPKIVKEKLAINGTSHTSDDDDE
ncbi:hypothetical protein PspLS_08882 [Pyricularia sp. CBS 133598]|nr:hypothetical protein PspLS_08882 [Pyricularia sp. CBS 133598]